MSKAILVIDMPESCAECDIMFEDEYSYWCPWKSAPKTGVDDSVYDYFKSKTKPDWCPLRPADEIDKLHKQLERAYQVIGELIE